MVTMGENRGGIMRGCRVPLRQDNFPYHLMTRTIEREVPLGAERKRVQKRRLSGPLLGITRINSVRPRAISEPMSTYGSSDRPTHELELRNMPVESIKTRPVSDTGLDENLGLRSSLRQPTTITTSAHMLEGKEPSGMLACVDEEPADRIFTSKEAVGWLTHMHELPPQHRSTWSGYLCNFLSMYRKIFALVFIANVAAAICVATTIGITFDCAATAAGANICAAILFRNEHVVNLMYICVCSLRPSASFSIRKIAAKVYSYGGLHSGCAFTGSLWYLLSTCLLISDYDGPFRFAMSGLAIALSSLLWIIVWFAFPHFRKAHHNTFEVVHRFGGWITLAVFWTQLFISAMAKTLATNQNYGIILIQMPLPWFLCVITVAIVYPWSRLRLRAVRVEVLSPRAAILHFDYDRMDPCFGVRITDMLLKETHSFATISSPGEAPGFRILMSRAGDWTANFIDNPPSHIWVKGAPILGVMRVALMFKKVLVVATGSGIGPCLSLLESRPEHPIHVLWMTSDPQASYGDSIVNAVFAADSGACIVDTSQAGRGDILALAYSRYIESEAEAVVIISNPKVTEIVVGGLESRGVAAFGAIFDS